MAEVDKVEKGFRAQAAEEMAGMIMGDAAPWQTDWAGVWDVAAYNPATKAPYRGVNALLLEARHRDDPRWRTAAQAAALGG